MIRRDFPQANFAFEVIRGHYDASVAKPITDEMYGNLLELAQKLDDPLLERSLQLHHIAIETIKRKKQVVPCNAGRNFIVLDHAGNLSPCEILPPFVNIRDMEYNFLNIANDTRWHKIIKNIRENKCYCTHMCFLGSSHRGYWSKLKTYIKKIK
jgi:radical SAM protein with 4Fe4S-binding SPASM domain